MGNLDYRLNFNLKSFTTTRKYISKLLNSKVWLRNVVESRKYSLPKFANLYINVLLTEKPNIFAPTLPQMW